MKMRGSELAKVMAVAVDRIVNVWESVGGPHKAIEMIVGTTCQFNGKDVC